MKAASRQRAKSRQRTLMTSINMLSKFEEREAVLCQVIVLLISLMHFVPKLPKKPSAGRLETYKNKRFVLI